MKSESWLALILALLIAGILLHGQAASPAGPATPPAPTASVTAR